MRGRSSVVYTHWVPRYLRIYTLHRCGRLFFRARDREFSCMHVRISVKLSRKCKNVCMGVQISVQLYTCLHACLYKFLHVWFSAATLAGCCRKITVLVRHDLLAADTMLLRYVQLCVYVHACVSRTQTQIYTCFSFVPVCRSMHAK